MDNESAMNSGNVGFHAPSLELTFFFSKELIRVKFFEEKR